MNEYAFVWKQTDDDMVTGFYTLCITRRDGSVVNGSEMHLWDYTTPWEKENHHSRDINNPETFLWSHCWGSSSGRTYTQKDGKTLEEVKKEMETFLLDLYSDVYSSAVKQEREYRDLAKWCAEQKGENAPIERYRYTAHKAFVLERTEFQRLVGDLDQVTADCSIDGIAYVKYTAEGTAVYYDPLCMQQTIAERLHIEIEDIRYDWESDTITILEVSA